MEEAKISDCYLDFARKIANVFAREDAYIYKRRDSYSSSSCL
jgi:hypothetical protein